MRSAARETFRSFEFRNFRLFFAGQLVSQVGNWLTMVAQALLVLKLTGNGLAVGIMTACQFAPVLFFGAWTGLVADRSDKRKLLLIVQVFAMAQSFLLGVLAFGHPPVLLLYAVAFAGGIATAFDNPARRSFVVEMVDQDSVHNAVSLNSALMTSSRVVGPALAGLLITTVGYGWAFIADGFSYLAVIAALWMIDTTQLRRAPVTPRGKGQVRDGLRYVRTVPDLWISLLMMGVVGTLAYNFQVVMPLFVTKTFDGTDATFTVLFSVLSVGSLLGALWTARRKSISVRDVCVASLSFGLSMLVLAAAPSLASLYPIGIVVGFTSIGFITASTAIVQVHADPTIRGRVLALQAIVFLGSTPIGGPILGAICDTWGARAGLAVGGIAGIAAAIFGTVAAKRAGAALSLARDSTGDVDADLRVA